MAVIWRERERADEDESECRVTKLMSWRYLRLRRVTAELWVASAMWIGHRSGEL